MMIVSNEGVCTIVHPAYCCKGARQVFCLDSRFSFIDFKSGTPLDPKFPCLCTVYGITCFYQWEFLLLFCAKWSEIKAKGKKAPAAEETAIVPT